MKIFRGFRVFENAMTKCYDKKRKPGNAGN